jgi:hypothetical protein
MAVAEGITSSSSIRSYEHHSIKRRGSENVLGMYASVQGRSSGLRGFFFDSFSSESLSRNNGGPRVADEVLHGSTMMAMFANRVNTAWADARADKWTKPCVRYMKDGAFVPGFKPSEVRLCSFVPGFKPSEVRLFSFVPGFKPSEVRLCSSLAFLSLSTSWRHCQ